MIAGIKRARVALWVFWILMIPWIHIIGRYSGVVAFRNLHLLFRIFFDSLFIPFNFATFQIKARKCTVG